MGRIHLPEFGAKVKVINISESVYYDTAGNYKSMPTVCLTHLMKCGTTDTDCDSNLGLSTDEGVHLDDGGYPEGVHDPNIPPNTDHDNGLRKVTLDDNKHKTKTKRKSKYLILGKPKVHDFSQFNIAKFVIL